MSWSRLKPYRIRAGLSITFFQRINKSQVTAGFEMFNTSPALSRLLKLVTILLLSLTLWWLLFSPVPFEAGNIDLGENPAGKAPFETNNLLSNIEEIPMEHGPEGVAIDAEGRIVSGFGDGRILRREADGSFTEIGNTKGRPLGIEFDRRGNLIIADAIQGLLSMKPNGEITILADSFDGKKMIFVDDLAIAPDGRIWFSDASQLYPFGNDMLEMFAAQPSGRLFVYDPTDKSLKLALDGLGFANGVAVARDNSFVLVNETHTARITRYWLRGEKAGQSEVFLAPLPGYPDNITEAPNGEFWLSLVAPRDAMVDFLMPRSFLRNIFYRLVQNGGLPIDLGHVWAVRLSADGEVLQVLEDQSGRMEMMTSVLEHRGKLYLGSLVKDFVGVYDLQAN
jgi:sugar lactone lactonase YvrE